MPRFQMSMAAAGWLLLGGVEFFWLPITRELTFLSLLILVFAWLWVIVWNAKVWLSFLRLKQYAFFIGALIVGTGLGAFVRTADWNTAFVQTNFWLHRDSLRHLAEDFDNGRPLTVPAWMGWFTMNGEVRPQGNTLYLPVWEDWRAETGVGIAYRPQGVLQTAAGDLGHARWELGDGWWWVQ
ncbi:hypothetical protein ACIBG8_44215 [Nonomuraea sp. NPDC050556]|uniref:hypothetical protein n=1 Tax=Nonomuraea sp. NPDC050556 TaxID=3364369 RepID=UPI0037BA1621